MMADGCPPEEPDDALNPLEEECEENAGLEILKIRSGNRAYPPPSPRNLKRSESKCPGTTTNDPLLANRDSHDLGVVAGIGGAESGCYQNFSEVGVPMP